MPISGCHSLSMKMTAGAQGLTYVLDQVAVFCRAHDVDPTSFAFISVVLDELLTNLLSYGEAENGTLEAEIAIQVSPDALEIRLSDNGHPFDPTLRDAPDVGAALEDLKIGGLGIHLVKSMSDSFSYARECERNVIRVRKTFRRETST
jgi:anti-sigma regulatory factor (Ser/Thr protein kinase)